tara:strand:- start:175 stop:576 length:402 start_codon:yes stop_codon:yes gene_type:complete
LQLKRENVIHKVVLSICATVDIIIFICLLMLMDVFSPPAWPTVVADLTRNVIPATCSLLAFGLEGNCQEENVDNYAYTILGVSCTSGPNAGFNLSALPDVECTGPFATEGLRPKISNSDPPPFLRVDALTFDF